MKENLYKQLERLTKDELISLSDKLNLNIKKAQKKDEIISNILADSNEKQIKKLLKPNFWIRNKQELFGWASIFGLFFTVLFFILTKDDSNKTEIEKSFKRKIATCEPKIPNNALEIINILFREQKNSKKAIEPVKPIILSYTKKEEVTHFGGYLELSPSGLSIYDSKASKLPIKGVANKYCLISNLYYGEANNNGVNNNEKWIEVSQEIISKNYK